MIEEGIQRRKWRMTLVEFSMIPLDKGTSFSPYVARLLSIIDESGLDYRLTAMGTIVEGEWEEIMDLLTRCFRELEKDSTRITLHAKFDYRQGAAGRLEGKVKSVEGKARRSFRT
jgi:uncharacterized protein (TIGR00106 family)